MAPIRIGFVGLSAGGSWASRAHLPYLQDSSKYKIIGLLNSSPAAAQAAIDEYKLPKETKTYASPQELAADADVDLVVDSVRVDKHYETIKPSVEAGKACYVEWPLGANLQQAEELNDIAHAKGARTMVGLQGRRSPFVNAIKRLIEAGRIGKVLSSSVVASAGNAGPRESKAITYFTDRKIGGNVVTIHFGHSIDYVLYTLGEFASFTSVLANQRPRIELLEKDGSVAETVAKDTPDQILLQGRLKSGAVLSVHTRGGKPFKGEPGLLWRIYGETGEIWVQAEGSLVSVGYQDMSIKVHDLASDNVETVDWRKDVTDGFNEKPGPAQNVARLYESFAEGRTDEYADWDAAVKLHKLLDSMFAEWDKSGKSQAQI